MKIKVCGMKQPRQIQQLIALSVDFAGLIFHPPSKRFAGDEPPRAIRALRNDIRLTGVFVDTPEEDIRTTAETFGLSAIQLHGSESAAQCQALRNHFTVLKAFRLDEAFDFNSLAEYAPTVDYFVFDAAGKLPGGNGIKFSWHLLNKYTGHTPFLLSGGIVPADAEKVQQVQHPAITGVDLNSRFEEAPGMKQMNLVTTFIKNLQT